MSINVHIEKVRGWVCCPKNKNLKTSRVHHSVCVPCSHHANICSLGLWVSLGPTPLKDLMKAVGPLCRRKKRHTFPYTVVSLKVNHGPKVKKNLWSSLPFSFPLYRRGNRCVYRRLETRPNPPSLCPGCHSKDLCVKDGC